MMKTVKYISVLIIAVILAAILIPVGFAIGIIYNIAKRTGSAYVYNVLIEIDQSGNVACSALFCLIFLKPASAALFGKPDETISSVLGKNKLAGTLTWCGSALCFILNSIQKNHVENAIEE